jgi:ADP-ribosylation factor-like protein 5B
MGFYLSTLFKKLTGFQSEREFKIIIVGLNNAGKTTILYKLALNEVIVTQPTIGSNVEEVYHNNLKMQVWDLGGQESLRHTWDAYYANTNAVIYVIDSADDSNIKASKHEFFSMLMHNDLKDASILIFANKADLPSARDVGEVTELYGLHMITNHDWKLQPCCALTGTGLQEGLDWLADKITEQSTVKKAKPDSDVGVGSLTNVSVRSSQFMMSSRKEEESKFDDNESSNQLDLSIKMKQRK